jgi:prepilin peptidase CpaA
MDPTLPTTDATAAPPQDPIHIEPGSAANWPLIWLAIGLLSLGAALAAFLGAGEGILLPVLCMAVCLVASGFDAATGHIPNELTYTAILLGLGLNSIALFLDWTDHARAHAFLGAAGPTQSLLGMLAWGGLGLVGLFLAGMGGGDMKLLAAVGAMMGLKAGGAVLLYALVIAVAYALVNLAIAGRLNAAMRALAADFLSLIYLGARPETARAAAVGKIPLAVPILLAMPVWRLLPVERTLAWLRTAV